jgi:hypothetical protein
MTTTIDEDDAPPPVQHLTTAQRAAAALAPVESTVATLRTLARSVGPMLAELDTFPVATARPAERAALVDLYWQLRALGDPIRQRIISIEMAWARGMTELGAKKLPLPDGRGTVTYEPPRAEWQVRADDLLRELVPLVEDGLVSKADLEAAFTTTISVKADNRVLNSMAESRGDLVRQIIDSHRTKPEPSPLGGRVRFPAPKGLPDGD